MKLIIALTLTIFSFAALSQGGPGNGPVITDCHAEIEKFCADKEHGQGEVRECLIQNKEKVSDKCKSALESRGPKMGRGQGKGKGRL